MLPGQGGPLPRHLGSIYSYALRKTEVPRLQNNIDAPRSLMVSKDKGYFLPEGAAAVAD
jgi:hypothetical protein